MIPDRDAQQRIADELATAIVYGHDTVVLQAGPTVSLDDAIRAAGLQGWAVQSYGTGPDDEPACQVWLDPDSPARNIH